MTPAADTIAAIATPPGRGGIGVVRVSGHDLEALIAGVVGRRPAHREATLADFRDAHGGVIDQGIVLLFPAPHSYTGETVVEFQGHGGPSVMRLLLARCVELGARMAEPGEFTKRAFLNGKLDLAQAESVADLIDAATATAARAAARSLAGEFSREIHALVDALTELRVYTEATLDFPEEDIEFLRAGDVDARLARLRDDLDRVLARARTGALLREGLTVVLVGRPNVGKSSLLNQLAREEAAIVTPIPGTTRDLVERRVEIAGIPLTVIDTAGLRETADEVERIGIARTWSAVERADLVVVLVDARESAQHADDAAILARLPSALPRVVVHNKTDLAGIAPHVEGHHVWVCARDGEGVTLLERAVLDLMGAAGDTEDTFLARARHVAALRAAAGHLEAAAAHVAAAPPPIELFAEDLRGAQLALSVITGEFTADDLLGAIFGRFCIGKRNIAKLHVRQDSCIVQQKRPKPFPTANPNPPEVPMTLVHRTLVRARLGLLAAALAVSGSALALDNLKILVPAAPGGGWDQTGRALQAAMQADKIVPRITVDNRGGAGGTIGLAQFVSSSKGDGNIIMIGGMVMLGAIATNKSPVNLSQVTPLARLTGEYQVVVVPASSKLQSMKDLVAQLKANPGSVAFGGGSAGGSDHILAGMIAQAVGVEPAKVNYIAYAGGGEAQSAIMGGHVAAGISGYGEFAGQIKSGKLRAIAISSDKRVAGIDIPTLKEQGVDVEMVNWRGVFGAPGITDAQKKALIDDLDKTVKTSAWQDTLKRNDWTNMYLAGDQFKTFLDADTQRIEKIIAGLGLKK